MDREALESLDREGLIRLVLGQAEAMALLAKQVEALTARVAELEAKLGLAPKTPDNSRVPLSKGQNDSGKDTDSVALLSSGEALGEPPALRVSGRHP